MRNITIKQLRYVDAAGRLNSFASAASECNISQTSIATAVDSLEKEIGFDLFRRTPSKGLQVTQSGREALDRINRLLESAKQFEVDIKSISGRHSGMVKVACCSTAATTFLPTILNSFVKTHPDAEVKTIEGNMEEVVQHLNNGNADFAFTFEELSEPHHCFSPLIRTRPFALVPASWEIAEQCDVSLQELAQYPTVLLDLPSSHTYIDKMFETRGLDLNIAHRTTSTDLIRSLVVSKCGFSILNLRRPAAEEAQAGYALLPIRDAVPDRVFGLMSHENVQKPPIVEAFTSICQNIARTEDFTQLTLETRFPPRA